MVFLENRLKNIIIHTNVQFKLQQILHNGVDYQDLYFKKQQAREKSMKKEIMLPVIVMQQLLCQ
jgi:hypothetical protein